MHTNTPCDLAVEKAIGPEPGRQGGLRDVGPINPRGGWQAYTDRGWASVALDRIGSVVEDEVVQRGRKLIDRSHSCGSGDCWR